MFRRSALLVSLLLASACSIQSGNLEPEGEPVEGASTTTKGRANASPTGASSDDDELCRNEPGSSRRELVCHRWRCEGREGKTAARWSGDAPSCNAGDLDADAADRALRVLNLHRFLAGLDAVRVEAAWTGAAQECALVAHANAKLSHTPPPDWSCWSEVAAQTSSVSLIANRSVPLAVAAFVEDPGNEATMVHRRWLLSERVTRVGLGSTDRYACIVVDGRALPSKAQAGGAAVAAPSEPTEPSPRDFVAWPPEGPVPMDVFTSERVDEIGWTVQSSSVDLDRATVSVSSEGRELPVRTTHLTPLLGSRSAIRFVPEGWKTEAGRAYAVKVTGSRSFDFTVEPTDCP